MQCIHVFSYGIHINTASYCNKKSHTIIKKRKEKCSVFFHILCLQKQFGFYHLGCICLSVTGVSGVIIVLFRRTKCFSQKIIKRFYCFRIGNVHPSIHPILYLAACMKVPSFIAYTEQNGTHISSSVLFNLFLVEWSLFKSTKCFKQ